MASAVFKRTKAGSAQSVTSSVSLRAAGGRGAASVGTGLTAVSVGSDSS